MERLTHRETPENKAYVNRGLVELHWYSMEDEGYRGEAIDRLAAYEDTKRTPEEVKSMASLFDYAVMEYNTLPETVKFFRDFVSLPKLRRTDEYLYYPRQG